MSPWPQLYAPSICVSILQQSISCFRPAALRPWWIAGADRKLLSSRLLYLDCHIIGTEPSLSPPPLVVLLFCVLFSSRLPLYLLSVVFCCRFVSWQTGIFPSLLRMMCSTAEASLSDIIALHYRLEDKLNLWQMHLLFLIIPINPLLITNLIRVSFEGID